jgi:asparagine synthase (glutamine-hydrolysing)
LEFDRRNYLVQDVVQIQENALMAHGIEGRSPYLDAGMIRLFNQTMDENNLKGIIWIKSCLKDLGWIAKRKKYGFGLPPEEWLSRVAQFLNEFLLSLRTLKRPIMS